MTATELAASALPPSSWREVGLGDDEFALIRQLLGRDPSPVELGMFGAMWSEHCGYKHSRPLLRDLPNDAPWVVQGPGENAGAIDIGGGLAAVFKVESHNHPSAVEPYEGAATGVGGIVRDIFTMGARPVALLNSLRFGPLSQERNQYLFQNVVAGIGGYGNCIGIPTVGGELFFDQSFSGNPLVNAMCIGIVDVDRIVRAKASGIGNLIMLIGADTGRDGLHGATFASVDDPESSHRGVVQVGNPFLEKLLLEACLELLESDAVVAMQDLGAAGLTSSTVECVSRGAVGAEIDVGLVARRESGMTAYEVMLSESQERMLLVVRPEAASNVEEVVTKWSLHSSVIGKITNDGVVRVLDEGKVVAEVPSHFFTDHCPTYVIPAKESKGIQLARLADPNFISDIPPEMVGPSLLRLLGSPNIGSREFVFEQYDHTILTNTVVPPGQADAAVLRIKGYVQGISVAIDCNSRYCYLDPKLGAQHAVAEASRNVSCTGARPMGATNCLNFGNPEKPVGYFQLKQSVAGLAKACEALEIPIVSGNVSLYNETSSTAVMPTPTVGIVGVLEDVSIHATLRWRDGESILLLGNSQATLGGSEYLSHLFDRVAGGPPSLDLEREKSVQDLVRKLIRSRLVKTAHDLSLGGLAVGLAKMAAASNIGATIQGHGIIDAPTRVDVGWFGECSAKILISCLMEYQEEVRATAKKYDVKVTYLGQVGGSHLTLGSSTVSLGEIRSSLSTALLPAMAQSGHAAGAGI